MKNWLRQGIKLLATHPTHADLKDNDKYYHMDAIENSSSSIYAVTIVELIDEQKKNAIYELHNRSSQRSNNRINNENTLISEASYHRPMSVA